MRKQTFFLIAIATTMWAILRWFIAAPHLWSFQYAMLLIVVLVALFAVQKFGIKRPAFWRYLLSAWLFASSGFFFLFFIEVDSWRLALSFILPLLVFYYASAIYSYEHHPDRYQQVSYARAVRYVNIATSFLAFSTIFGVKVFLGYQIATWQLVSLVVLVTVMLSLEVSWAVKLALVPSIQTVVLTTLLVSQTFLPAQWLGVSYLVQGVLLFFVYLASLSMLIRVFTKTLEKTLVWQYAVGLFLFIALILFTAEYTV